VLPYGRAKIKGGSCVGQVGAHKTQPAQYAGRFLAGVLHRSCTAGLADQLGTVCLLPISPIVSVLVA
jgi:hypothetical protein